MNLKDVYATLEGLENGVDMVETIKAEFAKVNQEAKQNRLGKETAEESATEMQTRIEELEQSMKKLQGQYEESVKKEQAERQKRIDATIRTATITELQRLNCVNSSEIAKLISQNVRIDDDENLTYGEEGKTLADGVAEYLKNNAWAVKNDAKGGSGANGSPQKKDTSQMTYSEMLAAAEQES